MSVAGIAAAPKACYLYASERGRKTVHKFILVAAIAALTACSKQAAPIANDGNMTAANKSAATPVPAAFSINETSWEYTQDGKPMQESIDATGNYITTSGAQHLAMALP